MTESKYNVCNECLVVYEIKRGLQCPKCGSWNVSRMGGYFRQTKEIYFNPSER